LVAKATWFKQIYIEFVPKSIIEDMNSFLDTKWEGVKAVPQTHKMHCYYPVSSSQLMVAETSDATEFKVVSIYKSRATSANHSSGSDSDSESDAEVPQDEDPQDEDPQDEDSQDGAPDVSIVIGQWVVVKYDEARYPGEVVSVDEDSQYEVNVMHPSGNLWKWPKTEDKIYYAHDSIARLINPPKAAGHRGQFIFDEQI
jgi:hypothetical protein